MDERTKQRAINACLNVYGGYHISQVNGMSIYLQEAWKAGQEIHEAIKRNDDQWQKGWTEKIL